ncbi:MAG: TIGR04053 family radical SAM/SPASM domain-containing protein [Polyangiaceae bacterium]|nr:TIGR04053 family radical SAM/SPASM domain-containing protein [Polyangiaceae bacterium]
MPEYSTGTTRETYVYGRAPRNVYWEVTVACDLACRHCRAEAVAERDPDELSTEQGRSLIDDVKTMGSLLVITGGDPMKRPDLFELMAYARSVGQPVAITPSTTPTLTREAVRKFAELGVVTMGVSLDGPSAAVHDAFRGVEGTYAVSQRALAWAREAEIPVQVNTTVCRQTLPHVRELMELLRGQAPPVIRWSLFILIPTGRGSMLESLTASELEELFSWVLAMSHDAPFHMSTVEAPHYRRYWIQSKLRTGMPWTAVREASKRMGFGMRDGNGVIFVARNGDVFPAGFLPYPLLGNVKRDQLSVLYRTSPALLGLRDMDLLTGKCGRCEFRWLCGGSRARAYATSGNVLGPEPMCVYQPGEAVQEPLL